MKTRFVGGPRHGEYLDVFDHQTRDSARKAFVAIFESYELEKAAPAYDLQLVTDTEARATERRDKDLQERAKTLERYIYAYPPTMFSAPPPEGTVTVTYT